MMRPRVLSFLVAFLIITVAFSVAFMNPVSADDDPEDWEPDNGKAIYLRPSEKEEKNYNYNYTDVALEEDVELDEGTNEFSYDSEISLGTQVHEVMSSERTNLIGIAVSAPGAYRWNEDESISNPNDGDLYTTPFGHVGTLGTAIEAEITGMEGYEGEEGDTGLQIQTRYNSADNFTDGDGDAGDPGTPLSEWQELAIEGGLLLAETYVDMNTLNALSWAQYAYKVGSTYAESDPIDPLPEHEKGESGEDASVSQSWEHNIAYKTEREYHLFNLGYSEYEEHLEEGPVDQELVDAFDEKGYEIDDRYDLDELDNDKWAVVNENGGFFTLERYENKLKIYGKDIPLERVHTASTMLYFELPTDDLPDEATLEISAKNILGAAEQDGEIIDFADGAEASVEIPIKNAEIQSVKNNPTSDTYNTYSGSKSVSITTGVTIPHNIPAPQVDYLNVTWDDGSDEDPIKQDWEPYTYEKPSGQDWYYFEDKETVASHTYSLPDYIDPGGSKDYNITVKAEMQDKYGGWEVSNTKKITINYLEDDGGGGGGCPYISPWNGTKFKRENNLMVQSEFQSGEVTDYYKLDSDLQQKNGNYSMKIEEFENSEDYIDQMKLYTIDHKEGYKVGVTPEGDYVTYKDSDAPIEAYNSTGDNVLNMVNEKNDDKRLEMDEGSEIILDYGDRSMSRWQFNKLILRSSGFSSHTEGSKIGTLADKTSLYVSIKADGSEWKNVTVTHPRNNPHDYVIPLEDQLTDVLGKGHDLSDFKVKIESTKDHHIDYVGLDNSAPTTVHVQEADLMETIKTDSDGNTKYLNRSLTEDDNAVMHLTPGESCTVNFDVPYQIPGFEERDFIVMTKGFYTRYE